MNEDPTKRSGGQQEAESAMQSLNSEPPMPSWLQQQLEEADTNGLMRERMLKYWVWLMEQRIQVNLLEQCVPPLPSAQISKSNMLSFVFTESKCQERLKPAMRISGKYASNRCKHLHSYIQRQYLESKISFKFNERPLQRPLPLLHLPPRRCECGMSSYTVLIVSSKFGCINLSWRPDQ
jgi:hypothetical protein